MASLCSGSCTLIFRHFSYNESEPDCCFLEVDHLLSRDDIYNVHALPRTGKCVFTITKVSKKCTQEKPKLMFTPHKSPFDLMLGDKKLNRRKSSQFPRILRARDIKILLGNCLLLRQGVCC